MLAPAEGRSVSLVNAIPRMAWPFNQMERSYPAVVNGPRFLHRLAFRATNSRRRSWIVRALLRLAGARMTHFIFAEYPADLYISCSPIYTQVLPYYMARWRRRAPFVSVATDLVSGHAFNYTPEADLTLAPTEFARREAVQNSVAPERAVVTGQPVWPDLRARMVAGRALRQELGFDDARPLALLIGGGDGMGMLAPAARAIAHSDLALQLLAVCGRNRAVKDELDGMAAGLRVRLKTLGFVTNVPELMGAADILVTKAGAATVAEGFIAGLPVILYDAVPGQEDGNVKYVVGEGAGSWCPSPQALVAQLAALLDDPASLAHMRAASARLARPDAAIDIARAALGLVR